MKRFLITGLLFASTGLFAAIPELATPTDLSSERREILAVSQRELAAHPNVPYRYSQASPANGMDCSGAVYYLLRLAGCEPPRSSAAQYAWIQAAGNLHPVPTTARTLDDPAFAALQPGDLIFWAPTPADPTATPRVNHVQIYLGREKADGRAIMIGSSEGRSYRGQKQFGFSIVDLVIPKAGAAKPLIAYGPPVWK